MSDLTRAVKIVVADDDPDILDLVLLRLELAGHHAVGAGDGAEAWALIREHEPELAVLDVQMPRMDGFEVLRRLRAEPETQNIGVILLTASVEDQDVVRGLEFGADEYLRKPFKPSDLIARVDGLLARA